MIESFFVLNEEEKNAVFYRKLEILYRGLEEELYDVNNGIHPDVFNGWSVQERENFHRDWGDDPFIDYLPVLDTEPHRPGNLLNQFGEGKRKHIDQGEAKKRQKPEEYYSTTLFTRPCYITRYIKWN